MSGPSISNDFNLPDVVRDCLSNSSHMLCDLVFQHILSQSVSDATHEKGNVLDLVITDQENLINNFTVRCYHYTYCLRSLCIIFSIHMSLLHNSSSHSQYILNFSKADMSSLNEYLLDYDYFEILNCSNVC